MSTATIPVRLTDLLRLLGRAKDQELEELSRAERTAGGVIDAHGVLVFSQVAGDGDVDLYDVIQKQLSATDRKRHAEYMAALATVKVDSRGEREAACDVACNAYTPVIDAAYHIGLAMGFAAAQRLGGAR